MPQEPRSPADQGEPPPSVMMPVQGVQEAKEQPRGGQHGQPPGGSAQRYTENYHNETDVLLKDGPPTEHFVSLSNLRTLGLLLLQELLQQLIEKLINSHNIDPQDVRVMLDKVSSRYV